MLIIGTSYDDTLLGTDNADTIVGYAGDDFLDGKLGFDSLVGGVGNDVYLVDVTPSVVDNKIVFTPDAVVEQADEGRDLVISASSYTLPANVEDLILTGAPFWRAYEGIGNSAENTILGADGARDRLDGMGGNDVLDGRGGADSIVGGSGDDTIVFDPADVLEDGGTGADTLAVAGTRTLTSAVQNVERVTLAGDLTLTAADVLAINSSHTLTVDGGATDTLHIGSGWTDNGGAAYHSYTQGLATLIVDSDITVVQ